MNRETWYSKIKPDKWGHRTRYSDSSFYDEVCILCGTTDGSAEGLRKLERGCPNKGDIPKY